MSFRTHRFLWIFSSVQLNSVQFSRSVVSITNKQNFYRCYFRKWPQGAGLSGSNMVRLEMKALGRYLPGKGNGNPLQDFCLENSMDRGTWRATLRGRRVGHNWSDLAPSHACLSVHLWIFPPWSLLQFVHKNPLLYLSPWWLPFLHEMTVFAYSNLVFYPFPFTFIL